MRKSTILCLVLTMCSLLLTSCPGEDCESEHTPEGYVVRMENDYSDYVMTTMTCGVDTTYSDIYIIVNNHTKHIDEDYYYLNSITYNNLAYTSILSKEWNDSTKSQYIPIEPYVIAPAPFLEVWEVYDGYSYSQIETFVKNKDFSKFRRKK